MADNPIDDLRDRLAATAALTALGCTVKAWAKESPTEGAPPRIVLYPGDGTGRAPADIEASLRDIDLQIVFECWAKSGGAAWLLRDALLNALDEQGLNPASEDDPGYFWQFVSERWDRSRDTTAQGQAVEVTCSLRFCAGVRPPLGEGRVDDTLITKDT